MCGIICCGAYTKTNTMDGTPQNLPHPPDSMVCPYCSYKGVGVYRRKVTYFTLFFVPLFPVKKGDPYISCNSCTSTLGTHGVTLCRSCRTAAPRSYQYCVRCGSDLRDDENRITE